MGNSPATVAEARVQLRRLMTGLCGVVRTGEGLERALRELTALEGSLAPLAFDPMEVELGNLLTVARLMVLSARRRTESRGVHLRTDHPQRDDERWRRHVTVRRDGETGRPIVSEESAVDEDGASPSGRRTA